MSADSGLRPGLGTDTDGQKFKKACIIRDVASVKLFIEANVHVNDREAVNFALKTAVERGNLDILNILLNAGIHMNKDYDGGTVGEKALAKAVFRKKFDCVTALLEAGVDVSQIDKDGVTMGSKAFMSATDHGHLDCLIPLIEAGVDVNQMDKDVVTMGEKAFLIAANRGHLDCLIPLIEAGVDVNQKNKDGVTMGRKALMSSARQGHVICLNTLIRAGINVNQKDKDGETIGGKAFKSATNCGHFDCLKILIEAGVNVNQEDKTGVTLGRRAFMCATKRGHLDCLKALIEAGLNVNQKDKFGVTLGEKAFMCATKREHLDYLKALIEAGVNVNQNDKYGGSIGEWAFLSAARCGHLDCLKALIGTGVNVNQEYNHRVTLGGCAFISATNRGHLDCLKALIEAGVNVNQKNEDKVPMVGKALVSAANRGHLDCLKSLIEAGVNVNQTNKGEEPVVGKALVSAANCGHLDCLKILIEAGVNVNQKDKYGITMGVRAVMGAVKHGHLTCLNALIETGIDLNQSDTDGITMGGKAVIGAVNYGHPICLNALIEAGIDLNQSLPDEFGGTVGGHVLGRASEDGDAMTTKILIKNGFDINRKLQDGTMAERALFKLLQCDRLQNGHIEIVDIFVSNEVDIHKQNTFVKICERNIKQLQEKEKYNFFTIALHYKLYEIFTGKTKETVSDAMSRDMKLIKDRRLKLQYQKAIEYYKQDSYSLASEVKLDEHQKMQLKEAFATGTEKDFCVESNFVGITGAGKTSLMWQLFLISFNPSDIEATNGIDISLAYCNIDLLTKEWKRREESDAKKMKNEKKQSKNKNTKFGSGIQVTQKQQVQEQQPQEHQRIDNLTPQRISDTERKPIITPVTKPKLLSTGQPITSKPDPFFIHRITQPISKQEANARGIDYAGQSTYYALHQFFLSRRGVNIIVLDGSKDFGEDVLDEDVRHIGNKKRANSKEFFRFLANSLRYYLPERTNKHIITVFTHKDVMKPDDFREKLCIVKEIIQEMAMTELFFENVFCINANDPNDKSLQDLRNIILSFSEQEKYWGQKMPSSWLLLEDKLMQKKASGQQVMTLKEIDEIYLKSSLSLDSRNQLLLFLKIHHEIGTVMYFADEGVTDIVILNPQWLIDSFKLVICANRFRDPRYTKHWDRLHEKGVVDKDFLYSVWKSHTEERFFEFKEDLILLMNRLDLVSSPKKYNVTGNYDESPYFIVPCMLRSAPEHLIKEYQNKATNKNLPLAFEFRHRFLPTATAYRMLATCVMEYGEMKEEETIYCDAAVFKVFENHYMTLEFTSSSIIANVLTFGITRTNVGVCNGVREFLEDALKCILASQKISANYSLLVACEYEESGSLVWLNWRELMENSEIICEKHKNKPPHVVKTKDILKCWLSIPLGEGSLLNKPRRVNKQPKRDEKPDHFHLGRISRRIPSKEFHQLFIELGLKCNDIETIKTDHKYTKQCILVLLLEWVKYRGSTYKQLADVLYKQQKYVLDIDKIQSCNCDWRADISDTFLGKEVANSTGYELDQICTITGSCYLELGLELGLTKPMIDAIEKENRKCHSITRKIIKMWIDKERPDDTWEVLGDALYEVGADTDFIVSMCSDNLYTPP